MSNYRRLIWISGRLVSTPLIDFWQLTPEVQDPSIPNLPISTPAGGPATIVGTLAVTDSADSAVVTGYIAHVGTLSATDGADSAAFSGLIAHTGSLSATDGADTAAFAGLIAHVGALDAADAQDTFAADGVVTPAAGVITGTMDATDGEDTVAFTGSVETSGVVSHPTAEAGGGGGMSARIYSKPKRKEFDRLWEELMALYEELSRDVPTPIKIARPVIQDYIKQEKVAATEIVLPPPEIDWAALNRDMTRLYLLIEQNRESIQDEEEAEMLLMM